MTSNANQERLQMQVAGKETLADGVVRLTLVDESGAAAPAWTPGSHIDLVLDDTITRQYSLCGDPGDTTSLTVAVLREADGRGGSIRVHDKLESGDLVTVAGPRNHFALVDADSYLFVAGGIGITPLLPMAREVDSKGTPWRLLYGGRTRASMAFADELADAHPDRVLLRPQDEHGHLDLATALDEAEPGTVVYCCGPEPLLQGIESACRERPHVTLHVERFAPKALPEGDDGAFEVELGRSGRTVQVAADETVLDAVLREGLDVDFSCREGTCGTCEVAVLGGTPDHRDSVLSEDEQAENDAMMICVSRSCTPKLILDL
ncbi:PDR/VanB family oxidoreductase [Rhodococcus koreensis]|uniref:PDR/VanB family oxidoreductase n=1 Tax=Rhodococcus koreensis TaxID=99653 RepID=UPI00197EA419|nr:PDR/VanB family oxidoreductase [Rhodococcus koreensis]QSE79592.1 oxidoreductase [Rhodococcus koreensis]